MLILPDCLPDPNVAKPGGARTRSAALHRLLRKIALKHQRAQPRTFYSLREVANSFTLPTSLVARVFSLLEEEGLIGTIRGSRTVLHGRRYDRHLHARGILGLPVSVFRFAAFADYRAFTTQLRRQLRRRGFMPAAIFFERHEIGSLLAESLFEAKVDTVVWFSPGHECEKTVAILRDAGVRSIGVNDGGLSPIPCRYEIRREKALRTLLRAWRGAGLTSTILLVEARGHSHSNDETCRVASEDEGLSSEIVLLPGTHLSRVVTLLSRKENRGILLKRSAAALLALREPQLFWRLMQTHRAGLIDGPISVLYSEIPPVSADLITVDWKTLAGSIVSDLISQAAWTKAKPLPFQAEAQLRVPLNRFCHEI